MLNVWPDSGTLATIASIITAFSVAMLFFRIQRELQMAKEMEINWIPWADWLLFGAAWVSVLFVILPLVAAHPDSPIYRLVPPAASGASSILVVGYTLAILAHYRLIFGGGRTGPRTNPEPGERGVVVATLVAAVAEFLWAFHLHGF